MNKNIEKEGSRAKKRKKARAFNICLYIISAILIITGAVIILRDQTSIFNKNSAEAPEVTFPPQNSDVDIRTPVPTFWNNPSGPTQDPSEPVSISFIDHDINVEVIPVGLNSKGGMATVPRYDAAGWFKLGAAPNQNGNCIIAGHNRYKGQLGLFSVLHSDLKVGDRIAVKMKDGNYAFYLVETIDNFPYNAVPSYVMEQGGDRRLTLITCLGDYDHSLHMSITRTVAVCKPVG